MLWLYAIYCMPKINLLFLQSGQRKISFTILETSPTYPSLSEIQARMISYPISKQVQVILERPGLHF